MPSDDYNYVSCALNGREIYLILYSIQAASGATGCAFQAIYASNEEWMEKSQKRQLKKLLEELKVLRVKFRGIQGRADEERRKMRAAKRKGAKARARP